MLFKWGNPNEQKATYLKRVGLFIANLKHSLTITLLTSVSNFLMSTFFPTHFNTFVNRISKWLNENEHEQRSGCAQTRTRNTRRRLALPP